MNILDNLEEAIINNIEVVVRGDIAVIAKKAVVSKGMERLDYATGISTGGEELCFEPSGLPATRSRETADHRDWTGSALAGSLSAAVAASYRASS